MSDFDFIEHFDAPVEVKNEEQLDDNEAVSALSDLAVVVENWLKLSLSWVLTRPFLLIQPRRINQLILIPNIWLLCQMQMVLQKILNLAKKFCLETALSSKTP